MLSRRTTAGKLLDTVDPVRATGLRVMVAAITGPSARGPLALAATAVGAAAVAHLAIREAVIRELSAGTVDIELLRVGRLEIAGSPVNAPAA